MQFFLRNERHLDVVTKLTSLIPFVACFVVVGLGFICFFPFGYVLWFLFFCVSAHRFEFYIKSIICQYSPIAHLRLFAAWIRSMSNIIRVNHCLSILMLYVHFTVHTVLPQDVLYAACITNVSSLLMENCFDNSSY